MGTFTVQIDNLPTGGNPGFLLLGISKTSWGAFGLPLSLGPSMPGCNMYTSPDVVFPLANVAGTATWSVFLCNCPQMIGIPFYNQGGVLDAPANPAGVIVSNAAEGVIGAK